MEVVIKRPVVKEWKVINLLSYKVCKDLTSIPGSFYMVAQASLFSRDHALPQQTNLPGILQRMWLFYCNPFVPCCVHMALQNVGKIGNQSCPDIGLLQLDE